MPRIKSVTKLSTLSMDQFCKICATTCTLLEELDNNELDNHESESDDNNEEAKFKSFLVQLPRPILEKVIPETLKIITNKIRKNRMHKGVLKAVQCLPQKCVQKLDFGSLFGEVRLYGHVNTSLKKEIRNCFVALPNLIELNLSSKCNDEMLIELAKHCVNIEVLGTPISDITDRGLLALCGIALNNETGLNGCFKLVKISVQNCDKITSRGVGCLLRNLPNLQYLYYDRLIDAVETVIKLDGDYLRGNKCLNIHHIDQFCDFYEFESHPDIIQAVAQVCPQVTSFRFFISDEGCRSLHQFPNFKHLQLEMSENISTEFEKLTTLKFHNLVTLHLTFRRMPHHALIELGSHCPYIEVVKLIGYGITSPDLLQPQKQYFQRLRIFETRMVRSDELLEQQLDELNTDLEIPITPEFVNFFLTNSLNIQDITISAMMSFLNEAFLMKLFEANPMTELQRLCISPLNKIASLTASLAFNVIMSLPNLHTMALSRWKMTAREIRQLRDTLKSQNFEVNVI